MLLSYTSSNIDNNRVMMEDFADQDWFAESDELASGGIHKQSAIIDDHHLHNVPQQYLQQQGHTNVDYLDLNVPIDENIFYSTNGEQTVTASASQHAQNVQHYLEVGVQNVNCGQHIQSSTSTIGSNASGGNSHAFQVDQLPLRNNFRSDDGTAGTSTPKMLTSQVHQEPNGVKCSYIDCMPSTSLAVLKPYTQEQSQICRSHIQQQLHPSHNQQQFYYDQRILPTEQHHQQFNAQELPRQSSAPLVRLESPPMHLAVSSASTNAIHQQGKHLQQHFYLNQQPLQHNQPFNSQISVIDHQSSSSFQLPLNYRPQPEQIVGHHPQQPKVVVTNSNAVFPLNQQLQQFNSDESGSAKIVNRKSAKTRRRPSVSNQSPNLLNNGFEPKQRQIETTTSGLDQVAKSLFNNQKTTTLEFGDPQLAMEFASLMGRCQQLVEQKTNGMDVTSDLKVVEERIADCILQNTTLSAIKATQNEQHYSHPVSDQIKRYSTSTGSQITSKPEKSRLPRKRPTASKKTSTNATILHGPKMIQTQKTVDSTKTSVQFIEFNPTANSSPTSTICFANNGRQPELGKDNNSKEKHISVLVPKSCSSSDNMVIYEKRSMLVPAQNDEKLIAEQLEKQKEKRRENLTSHFAKMREKLLNPDLNSPFKSTTDCTERLLPYGLFLEPEFNQKFIYEYDGEIKRHKELMQARQQSLEHRLRSALIRESLDDTHEQRNLLLYLDLEFERRQYKSEISQLDSFKNEEISNKPTLSMDWEYNEWDDSRYQNILSPIEQKEEQIETEIDIKNNFAEKIANCDSTIAEPRYASVSIRLLHKLPSVRNFKKFIIHTK